MEQWDNLPVREMILACTFMTGSGISVSLLLKKYPASRYLAHLLLSYLVLIVTFIFVDQIDLSWVVFSSLPILFYLYTSSFFTQKTRMNSWHISVPVTVGILSLFFGNIDTVFLKFAIGTVIIIYIWKSYRVLQVEAKSRGIRWFQNPGERLTWFRNFWALNVLALVVVLVGFEGLTVSMIAGISFVLISFVFFQMVNESSFSSPIPLGNKYQKSTLSPAIKSSILGKLEEVMVKGKFYLRDDASLSNLATELRCTTHHLSQVLNESKGISFQELISQYRIREARALLKDDAQKHTKVEGVATMVGYNSKSAFNTAFKKHTGLTPSEYRDTKDVRTYGEVPLPERERPSNAKNALSLTHVLSLKLHQNMVTNFFKIFIRNLKRNKVFTLINLFGLTVGFTCSLLIYLYIQDEMSFDKEIPRSEDIYRISFINDNPQTRTPHPMAQALVREWPEVESAVSISPWYGPGLTKQNVRIKNEEKNIVFEVPDCYFADSTFFDVFDLELVSGDKDALKKPYNIVISEETAQLFFGNENPIGKNLSLSDMPLEVAAVYKGMPKNSHFHFQALLSYVTLKQISPENNWYTWEDFGHFNYIKTVPKTDYKALQSKIPNWVVSFLQWKDTDIQGLLGGQIYFELQPLTDIHLTSNLRWELDQNGDIQYIYILSGTLLFILIIVSINYINLTTAKSMDRAKEIGVRKTLGAISSHMTFQFYLESLVFCFMAMILGFIMAFLALDNFNFLADKSFEFADLVNTDFLLKGLGLSVLIGLISGYYPALVLSGFKPSEVLKGKFSFSTMGTRLRGLLVIVQFTVSAILIASSLMVMNQISFMKAKELGFDQEQVISIKMRESVEYGGYDVSGINALINQFQAIPGVIHVSSISNLPGDQFNQHQLIATENPEQRIDVSNAYVLFDFEKALNIEIVEGRSFESSYASDSSGINFLVNEIAIKKLQLESPLGKSITWLKDGEEIEGKIIGVMNDFHYKSLHQKIQPLILQINDMAMTNIIIKTEGQQFQKTLAAIQSIYEDFESEVPFNAQFLDQQLAQLYTSEENTLNIFSFFTAVAIFLACLGLLGMAMAMLNLKIKEVGVRKILGASVGQIMQMIFSQFAKLITLALILGLPVAYLLMKNWMSEFAYQTTLGVMPFVWSSLLLLSVALLSVSLVVTKIAFTNPIQSLRYE